MNHTNKLLSACLALNLVCLAPASAASGAKPNFTGLWRLNSSLSDAPKDVTVRAGEQPGASAGAAAPRRRPFPPMPETLKIAHNEPEIFIEALPPGGDVLVSVPAGVSRLSETVKPLAAGAPLSLLSRFFHTGDLIKRQTDGGSLTIECRARWDGNTLITEIDTPRAGKLVESYALAEDGRRLHVTTRIVNEALGKEPIVLRRIYDLSDE